MREGKGGALLGLAFFSQPQKAGAGDRPERGTPKKAMFFLRSKKNDSNWSRFQKKNQKIKFILWKHLLLSVCRPLRGLHLRDRLGLGFLAILVSICEPFVRHWFVDNIC